MGLRLLWCALGVSLVAPAATLRLRIVDESGKPVWARLEVYGPDGKRRQPGDAVLDPRSERTPEEPGYRSSFLVEGGCEIEAAPGRYRVIAEHGLEYERIETSVDVAEAAQPPFVLRLKPWIRARDRGWWSADFHIHRPLEQIEAIARAEDINLGVVFTMWNKRNLWEGKPLPADPVLRISPRHLATVMNAEDERGGGAWMLHQIPEPLPIAVDDRWYPPGIQFVRQALARRKPGALLPWFDSEKLIWWEVPVMMALAPPDSLGLLNNHFNQYTMLENEAWGRPRDRVRFPGQQGFADYVLDLCYRYWNLGFRLPASAGSATGVLPNPGGYNRIYARIEGKPFSVENWYASYRTGPSFVTNGPMLFWKAAQRDGTVEIAAEAIAREPIDRVEIVANGRIVAEAKVGARQWRGRFQVKAANHNWIAARAWLKTDGTVRLAHTTPLFLDGQWDARADARYFTDWMDALLAQTVGDARRFATPREREEILELYRAARAFYAARM